MRKWAMWNPPHFRCSLALLFALILSLAFLGCGGGGGGGGGNNGGNNGANGGNNGANNGGNNGAPGTATITGKVVDKATSKGVGGAIISIAGTAFTATTFTDPNGTNTGTFTILNVPTTLTNGRFTVTGPAGYTNIAYYNVVAPYANDPVTGAQCTIPLPSPLIAGTNPLGFDVQLLNTSAPPPPPGPCP